MELAAWVVPEECAVGTINKEPGACSTVHPLGPAVLTRFGPLGLAPLLETVARRARLFAALLFRPDQETTLSYVLKTSRV